LGGVSLHFSGITSAFFSGCVPCAVEVRVVGDVCGFLHWDVEDFERLYGPLVPLLRRRLGVRDAEDVLSAFFQNPHAVRPALAEPRPVRFAGPHAEELNRYVESGLVPMGARLRPPLLDVPEEVGARVFVSPCFLLSLFGTYGRGPWEAWRKNAPDLPIPRSVGHPHAYLRRVFPQAVLDLLGARGPLWLANTRNPRRGRRRNLTLAEFAYWIATRRMAHIDAEMGRLEAAELQKGG